MIPFLVIFFSILRACVGLECEREKQTVVFKGDPTFLFLPRVRMRQKLRRNLRQRSEKGERERKICWGHSTLLLM